MRSGILVCVCAAVVLTASAARAQCIGDCNGDTGVTVDELLTLVSIALGTADATACPHGIPSAAQVDIVLILMAVNNALNGCPAAPTATPTQVSIPYGVCTADHSLVGGLPVAVALGDFDHNGSADIAVADEQNNRIIVLSSHINRSGSVACDVLGLTRGSDVTGVAAPVALAVSDFDRDGKPDVAAVGSKGVTVFFGVGDGTFETAGSAITVGGAPGSIAIADFNRDNLPDIIVANENTNDVSIILGTGHRTFASACSLGLGGRHATIVVAQDLNRDGQQDFAVASDQTNDVSVFRQAAPTPGTASPCDALKDSFRGVGSLPLGARPQAMIVGNFDLNAVPDLAVAMSSTSGDGNLQVFFGSSAGGTDVVYLSSGLIPVPRPPGSSTVSLPSAMGSGDVNQDGQIDLVVADRNNNDVIVFLNYGGVFTPLAPPIGVGIGPVGLAMGDIDNDGIPEVVTANQNDRSVSVSIGSRLPPTLTPTRTPTPLPTHCAGQVDCGNFCCTNNLPICGSQGQCCQSGFPVDCGAGSGTCCAAGTVCTACTGGILCTVNGLCPPCPGEVDCGNGLCCPNNSPVCTACSGGILCTVNGQCPPPPSGCPYNFSSFRTFSPFCAFSGYTDSCGGPISVALHTTGVNVEFLLLGVQPAILIRGLVLSPGHALLQTWVDAAGGSGSVLGDAYLSADGTSVQLIPYVAPFTIDSCLFRDYVAQFTTFVYFTWPVY